MATIHNDVLDAALTEIATATEAEVLDGSTLVKDAITLDASNYGTIGDDPGSSGGRRRQLLVSDGSDMQNIGSLSAGGSIDHVRFKDASGNVLVDADVSPAVNVGASDAINLGTFYVSIHDPS